MEDFYNAWHYLNTHRYFMINGIDYCFSNALDIEVMKVNPRTKSVDNNDAKNTKIEVWLECGPWDKTEKAFTHDIRLDTGGDNFEQAIINLAKLVKKYVGDK